jgi:uncharacterized protein YbaP (TraB family)
VDKLSDPEIVAYQNEKIKLPEGQTLGTVLNATVYKRLEEIFGGPDNMEQLSQYKPSVVINSLELAYLRYYGFTADGADSYYLKKSKQAGKDTEFLEDVKVQIDLLADMADGYENEYVSASLDELPLYPSEVDVLVSEWKAGTATATEASLNLQKKEWPTIYKTLIYDRNAAWIPEIENYLTTEPVEFVIVGLAHLHGPDGLLSQLKGKGCTIEQLVN